MSTSYVRSRRTASSNPDISRDGILVLDGYGISVSVERGHLVYNDGFGQQRRSGRVARATGRLRRLVVIGHSGLVTLDALRWLHGVGASFVHLDADGTLFQVSGQPKLNDARLRRAQAIAYSNGVGVGIARDLLQRKLVGQRRVLEEFGSASGMGQSVIDQMAGRLDEAGDYQTLRSIEANAAAAYWRAWSGLGIQFRGRNAEGLPEHWRTFGSRSSPLTESPRRAANPANAMLNYLYALLEAECRIAAITVGLDPGLGFLHADQPARDSLALDLMEAVRPDLDAQVLDIFRYWTFSPSEFFELEDGGCRLVAPLPRKLVAYNADALRWVGEVAESVAKQLMPDHRLATPLTETRRSRSRRTALGVA